MNDFLEQDNRAEREAEIILCGSLLRAPYETIREIGGRVTAEDFEISVIGRILRIVTEITNSGSVCDSLIIRAQLSEDRYPFDEKLLDGSEDLFTTWRNSAAYADIVHREAIRRKEREIGRQITDGSLDSIGALREIRNLLSSTNSSALSPDEAADRFLTHFDESHSGKSPPFIPTGYPSLDKVINGLVQSGLITLAARPGVGKTTVALNLCENIARTGKTVLYVSLEMSVEQIWARRVGIEGGLQFSQVYRGTVREDDIERVVSTVNGLSQRRFIVYDQPCTVDDIERLARCTEGLDLLVIDHAGLIRPGGTSRMSLYEQATETSHRLKALALSLHIPILSLCQLNRAVEGRNEKTPNLSDLRNTGAWEEDSDAVILLYRPLLQASEANRPKNWSTSVHDIDFIVAKNRHGVTDTITFNFCGVNAKITEKAKQKGDNYQC